MVTLRRAVLFLPITLIGVYLITFLKWTPDLQEPKVKIDTGISLPVLWSGVCAEYVQSEYLKKGCKKYSDDSVAPAQVLSKELIVRRVFFDHRTKPGNHSNATVFLLAARGTELGQNQLRGCRVGRYVSETFFFRIPVSFKWVQQNRGATSTLALVECYNIPQVQNGDLASLYYKTTKGYVVKVQSQRPLIVPEPRAPIMTSSAVTVVVCVGMIHTGAHSPSEYGMIYHWLRYRRVIGVDHVHMAVEDSFVRAGGLQNEEIQQAVKEGYVSIDFWPFWLSPEEVYTSQKLVYQDCLYRFQGAYDYIVYVDTDDFFVPVQKWKSIKYYLTKYCSGMISSCRFKWRQFFPDCGWDPSSIGADGNFRKAMTYERTMVRNEPKSGHQLKALVDAGTHEAKILLQGYNQTVVPLEEAYMAHLRFGWLPMGGCQNIRVHVRPYIPHYLSHHHLHS